VLTTLHRPSNVDDPETLDAVLGALEAVAMEMPVVFPMHPRTRNNLSRFGMLDRLRGMIVRDPLGYTEMLGLTDGAAVVLTDSGGLQEETTVLGVPCVTLREQTERPVTITDGTNRLAPWPLSRAGVLAAFTSARRESRLGVGGRVPDGWDGRAAERVADVLEASRHSATTLA
jgi:UDP-N-acetylglucosamine 2-epimerase (non-hydrolysing)